MGATAVTLIPDPTRILFFTGKGGVGKTSAACSTAIGLADAGRRVFLVSTDPASNLDEVLGVRLTAEPKAVPDAAGLFALNIDPKEAARAYRERVVGPYRGVLPEAAVASIEEQLSGACTLEIAAFDEFTKLLGDADVTQEYDHVIFDTAPTGHTLRLLELPAAWSSFIDTTSTARPASARSRGCRPSRRCTRPRTRRCVTPPRSRSCWSLARSVPRSPRRSAHAVSSLNSASRTCA